MLSPKDRSKAGTLTLTISSQRAIKDSSQCSTFITELQNKNHNRLWSIPTKMAIIKKRDHYQVLARMWKN